jgi:hypothetical protein
VTAKSQALITEAQLAAEVNKIHIRALRAAARALAEPEDGADYDGTGDMPWTSASIRVRAGLMLAQKTMDHAREKDVTTRQFQLMVVKERFKDVRAWEQHAAEVDAAPPTHITTLDAEVVVPLKKIGAK